MRNAFDKLKLSLLRHAVAEGNRHKLPTAKTCVSKEPVSAQQESYKDLTPRVPRSEEASLATQEPQATATAAMLEFQVTEIAKHVDGISTNDSS